MNPAADECLDLETLAALADGSLVDPTRARAEGHAAHCGPCRAALRDLVGALQEGAERAPAPVGLADRIVRALEDAHVVEAEEGAPSAQLPKRGGFMHALDSTGFRFPVAAAALLALGVGLFFWTAAGGGGGRGYVEQVDPAPVLVSALPEAPLAEPGTALVPARPADLGGEVRYLAHLSTDKPVYRPGETVYARAVLLEAATHKPLRGEGQAGSMQVKGARGEILCQSAMGIRHGVAGFAWQLPHELAGGTFTLSAWFPEIGLGETTLEFDVRAYRTPRLKTDLQFVRKAYGPGDTVEATFEAERAEGGIPAGAAVTAIARLDGTELLRTALQLDGAGRCTVSLPLPTEIGAGIGTLALRVDDGGVSETTARSLPIVLNTVDLHFYPEGGELVAGLACGLYFEARTPRQEPADVAGVIIDEDGNEVATFESRHEGRGRTSLVPAFGRTYRAVLNRPAGIDAPILLPVVKAAGVSLRASRARYDLGEAITVAVASPVNAAVTVGLYLRERELALKTVQLEAGTPAQVTLDPETAVAGVLRVTVFDDVGAPLAERLLLRRPRTALRVELQPDVESTTPGGTVEVQVRALDRHGRPVAGAVVGVSATDESVLATVDPRERAPRLPVQALLGAEVRELRDAARYLGGDAESAARADLLLGTQGWRRFCFEDVPAFREAEGLLADRVLARVEPGAVWYGRQMGAWEGVPPAPAPVDAPMMTELDAWATPPAGAIDGGPIPGPDPDPAPMAPAVEPGTDRAKVLEAGNIDLRQLEATLAAQRALREMESRISELEAAPGVQEDPVIADVDVPEAVVDLPPAPGTIPPNAREPFDPVPPEPPPLGDGFFPTGATYRYLPMAWHREYAHRADPARAPDARRDFTETVYWNVGLLTDEDGRASFSFDASDAITTLQLRADAFDREGGLAEADAAVEVRRPFYAEPKFPLEVSAGDEIQLPIALVNGTREDLPLHLTVELGEGLARLNAAAPPTTLRAGTSLRHVIPLRVHDFRGPVKVRLRVRAGPYEDDVTRVIQVVPPGFPIEHASGGILEGIAQHEIEVPTSFVPGSLVTEIAVYPTPLASMGQALAAMLREPSGCFEQTSSTNYPNVMALQYLQSHEGSDPAAIAKASALLARGYKRLVGFECPSHGYEWFGNDPGHAELTAYGVLEFEDMAQVMAVDAAMLARTRAWLLARRDGRGGFRPAGAVHGFGRAPALTSNAYILWALGQAGQEGLDVELAALRTQAEASQDPYVWALAAQVAWRSGDQASARVLLHRLAKAQAGNGAVPGAQTSITGSGGRGLVVETTALAVLAWLRAGEHTREVEAAMRWMAEQCQGGSFGSTQATVLALKAVIAYDASRAQAKAPGTLVLRVDGEVVQELSFEAGQRETLQLADLGDSLGSGRHTLRLEMKGGSVMPYSMLVRYNAMTPTAQPNAQIAVETELASERVAEGEPVEVRVRVQNRSDEGQPMSMAIVGLPGGLEVRAAQLKELVKEGRVDAVETRGREVILYWRALAPKALHALTLDCIAAVPGRYEGPASRAYLYYTAEDKHWIPGLRLEIDPR